MANRKQDERAKDVGSDSPASKEAAKGIEDASPPSSQADGDPGPEETKEPETLEGEDEETVHEK